MYCCSGTLNSTWTEILSKITGKSTLIAVLKRVPRELMYKLFKTSAQILNWGQNRLRVLFSKWKQTTPAKSWNREIFYSSQVRSEFFYFSIFKYWILHYQLFSFKYKKPFLGAKSKINIAMRTAADITRNGQCGYHRRCGGNHFHNMRIAKHEIKEDLCLLTLLSPQCQW